MIIYSPIVVFCYNRPNLVKRTIESLKKNDLASESELIIFSDGAKDEKDLIVVKQVRAYLKTIGGFKNISIHESALNQGVSNSIIDGISLVLEEYDRIIVLEDDLELASNFLNFMNDALEFYHNEPQIFSITGFSIPIENYSNSDVYFTNRSSSHGWGTWKDTWETIDWDVLDYDSFKCDLKQRYEFNKMGSDKSALLDKQMKGKIDSWAIRWCFYQWRNNLYSVHPYVSKIQNIGFGSEATHSKGSYNPFITTLDTSNKIKFSFDDNIKLEKKIIRQFIRPYSVRARIIRKIRNIFETIR